MKEVWNRLTPLKDDHMIEYITVMFKPINLADPKVLAISASAGILTTAAALLEHYCTTYLGISGKFSLMLLIILFVDFITGTLVAMRSKEGTNSRAGRRTIYKVGSYLFFIYVSFMLKTEVEQYDTLFNFILRYFHPFLLIHITFWEMFSVDENLKKLKIDLGITGFLKGVYDGITNKFKTKIKDEE